MSTASALLPGLFLLLSAADPAYLRELLHDRQNPREQHQAALLLVQSAEPEAEEIIRQGLRQTEAPDVFAALASAIRLSRDSRFSDELLAALRGGPAAIRQAAAETLSAVGGADLVPRLRPLVENDTLDFGVRQSALWALGQSGRKAAVPVLLEQLSHKEEMTRLAAAEGLADLTGLALGTDPARWRAWWERQKDISEERWLAERLAYQASRARRLERELERSRAQVLRLHQQLYTRLPAADRPGHVQTLVDHEDPAVRALAVAWAGELLAVADAGGQRTLADLLLQLSRDGTTEVQRQAVLALGRVQDPRAFDRLRLLLRRGAPPVRAAAARALAQQARGGMEAAARQREVVPLLQAALEDPSLEVVVEAAEDLGTLGVPEAGPVLAVLLRHPSTSVRQTAAQALERVADPSVLDGLLEALEDPVVTVRFSVLGALARAAGEGHSLTEAQHNRLSAKVEVVLLRDADPGVRSRAATVLGQCATPALLPTLWRRVLANEDSRVQEKAWAAVVEIVIRSGSLSLVREWDRVLAEARQGPRRLQLLGEVAARWQKRPETKALAVSVTEDLVQAQLEQGKWAAALPLVRELLAQQAGDSETDRRLGWLFLAGDQALKEGNRAEALRAVQEAQPHLARHKSWTDEFERLEKQAKEK